MWLAVLFFWLRPHLTRLLDWLDDRAFPVVIASVIYPLAIVFDLLLLPLLIVWKDQTVLVLLANSYLNVASASVSAIILRQQGKQQRQQDDRHRELLAHHDRHHARLSAIEEHLTTR